MSITYVSAALRRQVIARADNLCEYCLMHVNTTFLGCEVDHIVSEKHGGPTTADNLAYACFLCNRCKGSDVGSFEPGTMTLTRFFNPRADRWADHFALEVDDFTILTLTPIGEATARIFEFNTEVRLLERQALQQAGRYPMSAARRRINGQV